MSQMEFFAILDDTEEVYQENMTIVRLIRETFFSVVGIYAIVLITATALLFLTGMISSVSMQRSLEQSIPLLKSEGQYPTVGPAGRPIALDNFTDSLMLNTAYVSDTSAPLRSVLLNSRGVAETNEIDQIVNLEAYVLGTSDQVVHYERYWHGYLITLRPLLTLFSLAEIRIVLSTTMYLLAALFLYVVWRNIGWQLAISLLMGLLLVDFWLIGSSLQFSSVFILGLVASIFYSKKKLSMSATMQLFFVLGCATAFFDLLTAPLVSLGLLLTVVLTRSKSNLSLFGILYWFVGYGLFWLSKWILVEMLVQPGAIATALDQVVNRTVAQADANFSHSGAIILNVKQLIGYSLVSKIVMVVLFASTVIALVRFGTFSKTVFRNILPWLILAVIPYLWYAIAANHSYLHVWYTYRTQLLTVVSLSMVVLITIQEKVRSRFPLTSRQSNKRSQSTRHNHFKR